ncbi:hypothetical protein GCM10007385_38890 [Tateyamaria omphalii]|uniref:hypothetical protein n=1 Tax=Tateyamaria omphalii TaxID=299262 RepID=UPI0016790B99|nr:hypothetical protein [Tateyamaria omphalii]GGX65936.1 hypothetical protein GCM10007385_38890 [Tateyamaria omphalii]
MTQLNVFTLTPQAAAQALQDNGLDALGLTMPHLSNVWGAADPTFDAATLRLTPSGNALAPFRGTLEYLDQGHEFRDVSGAGIAGPVAAFRLHPQAVTRLSSLMARYAVAPAPHHRPVPETLVFTGAVPAPDRSPQTYEPGESLGRSEPMSFHDHRGLIIDPVAVAALFDDLITAFPALDSSDGGGTGGAGGVGTIAGLASGIVAQVVDLHGNPFVTPLAGVGVEKQDGSDNATGNLDGSGLVTLTAGEVVAATGDNAANRIRLGWATGGTMAAGPLEQPGLPGGVTLSRQFLRAYAVDLDWHLRGNRTTSAVAGVPAEDGDMPDDLKPQVRTEVVIDYAADGPDLMALSNAVLTRMDGAAGNPLVFAAAPQINDGVPVPPAPGAPAHWPAFPAAAGAGVFGANPAPLAGATATWTAGENVVVVLAADVVPDGSSVRIYNQRFISIPAIGETPSFKRGDGGAAIAVTGQPTQILVHNPLGLEPGDPKPDPGTLVFDMVVTPRNQNRRLFAARTLPIAAGPATDPPDVFVPAPDRMAAVPDTVKSIAPVPLFGTDDGPDDGAVGTPVDAARALASETVPRSGPRLPTMGRLETVVVSGIGSAAISEGLDWSGVLSGTSWSRDALSASHGQGNPGNPAGPDTQSSGVRVEGALAYDLARHAVRRVQPFIPLPGGPPPAQAPGWLAMSGGDNMDLPERAGDPPAAATSSGVLLQSIAAVAETPELSLLPPGNPLDSDTPIDLQTVINDIASALSLPAPTLNVTNGNRLLNELRREYELSVHGARDALWSLARAFHQAEELVYIETAGLARTVHAGGDADAVSVDLIQILADRLSVQPRLKVVVCTPRETDFEAAPYVRAAIQLRTEALQALTGVAPGRVAAFHPNAFPGRAARVPGTAVVVDDVYSLTGATHLRRRGISFDGSAAVASVDQSIAQGYSAKVRTQRVMSMAARMGIAQRDAMGLPTSEFIRLQRPAASFSLVRDLVEQGGLGLLEPNWEGPSDATVILQTADVADPDGSDGANLTLFLAALLS